MQRSRDVWSDAGAHCYVRRAHIGTPCTGPSCTHAHTQSRQRHGTTYQLEPVRALACISYTHFVHRVWLICGTGVARSRLLHTNGINALLGRRSFLLLPLLSRSLRLSYAGFVTLVVRQRFYCIPLLAVVGCFSCLAVCVYAVEILRPCQTQRHQFQPQALSHTGQLVYTPYILLHDCVEAFNCVYLVFLLMPSALTNR